MSDIISDLFIKTVKDHIKLSNHSLYEPCLHHFVTSQPACLQNINYPNLFLKQSDVHELSRHTGKQAKLLRT